jgi:hypothetical protein
MAGTVTSQLTNVTLAEAGDSANWDDMGSGPGSGQSDDVPIQGSENRSRKVDNATDKGFSFDNTTGLDLTGDGTHVGFWVLCFQPSAITNIEIGLSTAATPFSSNYDFWEVFGSASKDYPSIGGWQRVWLDVMGVVTGTSGTIDYSTIRQFGARMTIANVTANVDNFHLDRIDFGTAGLLVDAGTAPSPATFADFVTADETNAYGVISSKNGVLFVSSRLIIADATATIFNDEGVVVSFADQALTRDGYMGISVDLQSASTDIDFTSCTFLSGGATRKGDFRVSGNSGACDLADCNLGKLRRVLMTDSCTLSTTSISECGQIDPVNEDYGGNMDMPGSDEYIETQETPDLSNASGDLEIIMHITPDDWTPSSPKDYAAQDGDAASAYGFIYSLRQTGEMRLTIGDGSSTTSFGGNTLALARQVTSTQGNGLWIRAVYDHSAGRVDHYESADSIDTAVDDISWTAAGSPTGTARSIVSQSRKVTVGASNDESPAYFCDGKISYFEFWTDGFSTVANHGDLTLRMDLRTGPDFTGSPATRADDFDAAGITWEEKGTAPVYTQGDNNTASADISGCSIISSVSSSALKWNVNSDPDGELDDIVFTMGASGHAIELGPNCPTTITLTGHTYSGYAGTDGSTGDEVIYNNSGKSITINVTGDIPTVRNGNGSSTTVNNNVTHTLTDMQENTEVTYVRDSDSAELFHLENVTVSGTTSYVYNYVSDVAVTILVFHQDYEPIKIPTTLTDSDQSIPISQVFDRSYDNPV